MCGTTLSLHVGGIESVRERAKERAKGDAGGGMEGGVTGVTVS